MRRPLAYKSSSIARSRNPSGLSTSGAGQQRLYLSHAECAGQHTTKLGMLYLLSGINVDALLQHRVAVKAFERAQPARGTAGTQLALLSMQFSTSSKSA